MIELSFLHYLLSEKPPADLLRSAQAQLDIRDPQVKKIISYLCDHIPRDGVIPDAMTLDFLLGEDKEVMDTLKSAMSTELIGRDFNDYDTIFRERRIEDTCRQLSGMISEATKRKDYDAAIRYSSELAAAGLEGRNKIGPVDTDEFLDIEEISRPEILLSTHLPELNQHLGGWPSGVDYEETGGFSLGELAIIGGSTNMGKSCLATSLWYNFVAKSIENPNYRSVYLNYEDTYVRFKKTFFAMVTGYYPDSPWGKLYDAAEKEYLKFVTPRKDNFLVYDGSAGEMPFSTVALEVELSKKAEEGFKIFFIDTINSIDNKDDSASHHITERAMRMLERVAKRYNVLIIATAQNKQGLQFEEEKWPELRWIGQSASLQQKCGVGLGIYRADLYSGNVLDYTTIAIMKLRHRGIELKEGINVSYDKRRRMYVPYTGGLTSASGATEFVQNKQIFSALKGDIVTDYAQVD